MKRILVILLGLLCGCDADEGTPLRFGGVVQNGDAKLPLEGAWVKIKLYDNNYRVLKIDSTLTDNLGNYFIEIRDNEAITQYSVHVSDDYLFKCDPFIQPAGAGLPNGLTRLQTNFDEIDVCVTGLIEFSLLKVQAAPKDTLTISSRVQVTPSIALRGYVIKAIQTATHLDYYFAERVKMVEYTFSLKKENGETSTWTSEVPLEPRESKKIVIEW